MYLLRYDRSLFMIIGMSRPWRHGWNMYVDTVLLPTPASSADELGVEGRCAWTTYTTKEHDDVVCVSGSQKMGCTPVRDLPPSAAIVRRLPIRSPATHALGSASSEAAMR